MTVVGLDGEFLLIDAGLSFPTEEMHGVDIVIPDTTFLRQNKERLRAIVLTHGHEDHVGALPYILPEFRVPVYGSLLTIELVKRKLSERMPLSDLDLRTFSNGSRITIGNFDFEPIHVTHSLPDSYAIAIHTSLGAVVFTGDFKLDFTPVDGRLTEISRLGELGDEGVLLLLSDSTNADTPGWSPSEKSVVPGFERVFSQAPGRILITTFATNLHRIQQAFDIANAFGRKVALAGRSMEQNIAIARETKRLRIPKGLMIRLEDCDMYEDHQIVILTTGAQGEPLSALNLMSKDEYPRMQIRPGDTVIYSARPIPGNETAVWQTVNRLFRQGAWVLYGPEEGQHVSGHAYQEELKLFINLMRPKVIAPVHGEPRHQYHFCQLAREMGYTEKDLVVLENGNRLVLTRDSIEFAEDVICGRVLVDSSGYAGVTDDVLRDRQNLANDGVVFIHVAIDSEAGKIVGTPEIVTRGVVGLDGALGGLQDVILSSLQKLSHAELHDTGAIHQEVSDLARRYFKRVSNKRPLVIASVIDV